MNKWYFSHNTEVITDTRRSSHFLLFPPTQYRQLVAEDRGQIVWIWRVTLDYMSQLKDAGTSNPNEVHTLTSDLHR